MTMDLSLLKELVDVLREGGPYAVTAIFILMWWRKDVEVKGIRKESAKFALEQVATNVKTERSLVTVGQALNGLADHVQSVERTLTKILTIKQLKLMSPREDDKP